VPRAALSLDVKDTRSVAISIQGISLYAKTKPRAAPTFEAKKKAKFNAQFFDLFLTPH